MLNPQKVCNRLFDPLTKKSFNKKAREHIPILCFEISVSKTILLEQSCTVKKPGRN